MEDRFSSLPDPILCHILSLLTTKEAVTTSILSKRWIPLWRSVPTLDFDDSNLYGGDEVYARFVEAVYKVILARDFNQPIKKFRLVLTERLKDPANISVWVNLVLKRRVEHIDISLHFEDDEFLELPHIVVDTPSMFSCTTLVVLKLEGLELKANFSSVDLPFLKVLHLQDLLLQDEGCLAEILSGCLALEDLKARDVFFDGNKADAEFITLPKLVRADISESGGSQHFMMKVVNNVSFLRIHEIDYNLIYMGEDMFHNLTHLELVYTTFNRDWFEVLEFLKYCPKLEVLVIKQPQFYNVYLNKLGAKDWQYPSSVPECILLHLKECCLNHYRGTKGELQFAKYIMEHGRLLNKMTICSSTAEKQGEKLENLKKLFSCTRCSATCKFSFK